jgi:diguanylate cyclase (GGDEF)-like protein
VSSALAVRVVATMRDPIQLSSGASVSIGASVGVAVYPEDASNRHDLMRRADEALYRAKSAGKDRFAVV